MNLFEISGKISLDGAGALSALSNVTSAAKGAAGVLASLGGAALKVGGAVAGGVATAGGAIVKQAVSSYAAAEQLVGGIETLFGDNAGQVQQYAAEAFKTAGLSSNEYMETAMGFSASLKQSLNGDTAAMAEYANMAIIDMSDNANKMGTDMGMIQNAYQGFAKQNYTMLDNLKLGYGGTKTEMIRLIDRANELKEDLGETGDLSIDSFADVVEAIHIVQTEMGITGTTAKEASDTISGSAASMKAAWSNLMTGVADENADMGKLVDNFVESGKTAAENFVPRVGAAISGTMQLAQELVPDLLSELELAMPELQEGVSELLSDGLSLAGIDVSPKQIQSTLSNLFAEVGKTTEWISNGPIGELGKTIGETISGIGGILSDNGIDISAIFDGLRDGASLVAEPLAAATGAVGEFGKAMVEWFSTDGTIANAVLLTAGGALGDLSGGLTTTFDVIGGGIKSWNELMRGDKEAAADTWNQTVDEWANDVNTMNGSKFSVGNLDILPAQKSLEETSAQLEALDAQLAADRGLGHLSTSEFTSSIDGVVYGAKNQLDSLDKTTVSPTVSVSGTETAAADIENVTNATEAADGATVTTEVTASGAETATAQIEGTASAAAAADGKTVSVKVDASSASQATAQIQQSAQAMQSAMEFSLAVPPVNTSSLSAAVTAASDAAAQIQAAFDGLSLSIPTVGVGGGVSATSAGGGAVATAAGAEYYASGGIMMRPTEFGFNPYSGNRMIGGESGPEAIAPITTLQNYVGEAVAEQNAEQSGQLGEISAKLDKIDDLIDVVSQMVGMSLKINGREFGRLVKNSK